MAKKLLVQVEKMTLSRGSAKPCPTVTVRYKHFSKTVVHFEGATRYFTMDYINKRYPLVGEILSADPVPIAKLPFEKAKALRKFTSAALENCLSEAMAGITSRNGLVTVKISKLHPMIRSSITSYLCSGQNPDEAKKAVDEHFDGVVKLNFNGQDRFPVVNREVYPDDDAAIAA